MSPAFNPPEVCPVCGETVPRRAKACPGCGADERSGWNENDTRYDGLDLPETNSEEKTAKSSLYLIWIAVAIGLLAALIVRFVFFR